MRHEREYGTGRAGWTRWISPIHRRYQMACCDCGLVHTLQFQVLRVTRYTGRGTWSGQLVAGMRVQIRARRDERATAQARRWKPKRVRLAMRMAR